MSRDDGFRIADVATGLMADPKVVALARRLRDSGATANHVMLFTAVILASWDAGRRVTLDQAAPAWWLDDLGPFGANLTAEGLLDEQGCIPTDTWGRWFGPARDRRAEFRARASRGGLAKAEHLRSAGFSPGSSTGYSAGSGTRSTPTVPTDLSDRPTWRAPAREATPFEEEMRRAGYDGQPQSVGPIAERLVADAVERRP